MAKLQDLGDGESTLDPDKNMFGTVFKSKRKLFHISLENEQLPMVIVVVCSSLEIFGVIILKSELILTSFRYISIYRGNFAFYLSFFSLLL